MNQTLSLKLRNEILRLLFRDCEEGFVSQMNVAIKEFKYCKKDNSPEYRKTQADKFAAKSNDCAFKIIQEHFEAIADELPIVFNLYHEKNDAIREMIKNEFDKLVQVRTYACPAAITPTVWRKHWLGRYFLGDYDFYLNWLSNKSLIVHVKSCMSELCSEIITTVFGMVAGNALEQG